MSDNNDFLTFFTGMIIGGLVGAATALLLAPASGEETRAVIRDKSIELKDKAVEYGQDMQLRAEKALEDTREQLDVVLEDLRDRIHELSQIVKHEQEQAAEMPPAEPNPAAE